MTAAKRRILIVDDDADFVESNTQLLKANGYEVLSAANGKDGLALAKREKPDLMLLDVMMATDTEGFEVSRKIPQMPELRNMKVMLVTGIRKAMKLPFSVEPDESWLPVNSVFEKPILPATLLDEIKKRLA